jgi:hypothetical protein
LIDRVERFAGDVLDHRAHGAAILGRIGHDDLDLLELGRDRTSRAAMAGLDDEAVAAIGFRRDDRRLDDADGHDGRGEQRIALRRGFGLAGIIGIILQRARVDLDDMHGKLLFTIVGPACRRFPFSSSSRRPPPNRGAGGPVQLRPSSPARPDKRGCKALRRMTGRDGAGGG